MGDTLRALVARARRRCGSIARPLRQQPSSMGSRPQRTTAALMRSAHGSPTPLAEMWAIERRSMSIDARIAAPCWCAQFGRHRQADLCENPRCLPGPGGAISAPGGGGRGSRERGCSPTITSSSIGSSGPGDLLAYLAEPVTHIEPVPRHADGLSRLMAPPTPRPVGGERAG